MGDIVIKLMLGIGSKFITEAFLGRILVYGLRALSDSTKNKLDDEMVDAVADALGIKSVASPKAS